LNVDHLKVPLWQPSSIARRTIAALVTYIASRFKAEWPIHPRPIGADDLAGFHRWRGWTRILAEIPLAVISRPGFMAKSLFSPMARRFAHARLPAGAARRLAKAQLPAWIYLTAPLDPASSTALRVCA